MPMSANEIIVLMVGLQVALLVLMAGLLIRLNTIPWPTLNQVRTMTLLEALIATDIGVLMIVAAILFYRLVAPPLWVFLGLVS